MEAFFLDDDTIRNWHRHYRSGGLDELTLFDWHVRSSIDSPFRGNRMNHSRCNELEQKLIIPTGELAFESDAVFVRSITQDV